MPGAHRANDVRFCGGKTRVINQSTVFVNDKLWAVKGDIVGNHGGAGYLKPVYGPKNVYVENKLIIVAVGDSASAKDRRRHPPGPVNPKGHSNDTIIYGGAAGA